MASVSAQGQTALETVWEGQRWWVGLGFRAQAPRFRVDGDENQWPSTHDAVAFQAKAELAAMKESAAALQAKAELAAAALKLQVEAAVSGAVGGAVAAGGASGSEQGGGGGREEGDGADEALTVGLLEAANRAAAEGCWVWAAEGWCVVRDGSTDDEGWTYATDWARFSVPREGGRKSQRNTDVVRRRRLTRTRQLVSNVGAPGCAEGTGGLLGAVAALEELRKAEVALEKEHTACVLAVVKELTMTHVLSRSLSELPADPTAWYRLSNTHRDEMAQLFGSRPAVTTADLPILADLARAMRFANGAYGFAADKMTTVASNLKMHTAQLAGGVDCKDGVDAELHSEALCRHAGIPSTGLIFSDWNGTPHAPACFVAVADPPEEEPGLPPAKGWLVVGIRGTLNINDCLCDVDAAEVDLLGGKAHQGFAQAAESTIASTEAALLAAVADPRHAGYEIIVTGHSLGGCTAEIVALKLRHLGKERGNEMLSYARCMAFAGGPAATPDLQQSAESKDLTVCVVYGNDIVPRLGAASVVTLLDELTAHGVLSIARRKYKEAGTSSALPVEEADPPICHEYAMFPGWIGLPNGGRCTGCGQKRWKPGESRYCAHCLICENCCAKAGTAGVEQACTARAITAASLPEPEPEPEMARPTQMALAGRVLWIDPNFKPTQDAATTPQMRWLEWEDLIKVAASSKMIEHHLSPGYLGALEMWVSMALAGA